MSSRPEGKRCEICRFSISQNGGLFCRRNPPLNRLVPVPASVITKKGDMEVAIDVFYPQTIPGNWCGQYEAVPPKLVS